jgi:hypothetical protein
LLNLNVVCSRMVQSEQKYPYIYSIKTKIII